MTTTTYPLSGQVPFNPVLPDTANSTQITAETKSPGFPGRAVSVIKTGVVSVADFVAAVAHRTIVGLADISKDTNAVVAFYRKMERHVVDLLEYLSDTPGKLGKMAEHMRRAVSFVDCFQLAGDLHYFLNGGYKEVRSENGKLEKEADNKVIIAARVATATADVGGTLLLFEELGFYKLNTIANAIGNTRLFSFVPKVVASIPVIRDVGILGRAANALGNLRIFGCLTKISCLFVTLRALDLMHGFYAIDAARRLVTGPSACHKISAGLDFTSSIGDLVLSALLFAGVTNVVGLGVIGAACITMTAASFLYRASHNAELKPVEKRV